MSTAILTQLRDPALHFRIQGLNDAYAACLDDDEVENWASFFTDDAFYRVISRENFAQDLPLSAIYCDGIGMIKDRAAAIRESTIYMRRPIRHMLSGLRIMNAGNGVYETRGNFTLIESPMDDEARILMVGRYFDRVVERDGELKFAERSCVYDNYRIHTTLIFPV